MFITCKQGGEELPDCTHASVAYESICSQYNLGAKKIGELKTDHKGAPSLYVGETSLSIQERALEHWEAAGRGDDESHITRDFNTKELLPSSISRWLAPT